MARSCLARRLATTPPLLNYDVSLFPSSLPTTHASAARVRRWCRGGGGDGRNHPQPVPRPCFFLGVREHFGFSRFIRPWRAREEVRFRAYQQRRVRTVHTGKGVGTRETGDGWVGGGVLFGKHDRARILDPLRDIGQK